MTILAALFLASPANLLAQTTVTLAQQYYGLGGLDCVAYSPDGNYILTGGSAGAFLWEIQTGNVVRIFSGHTYWVLSVAFSPDGTKVVTGSGDRTAKLWDAANGSLLLTFSGHTSYLYSVAFSPDGSKVLTGSADTTAKLWDASNGSLLRTFSGHTGYVNSVAFSPDGTMVLTGSDDGTAKLWDASNGSEIRTFSGQTGYVNSVAFSPDGTKVVTGSGDNTAKLWDAANGTLLLTFSGHTQSVSSVAFSPDGTKVLTGSSDYTAKLWNASNGSVLHTFSGHTSWVNSVAFSPDGTKLLTGSGLLTFPGGPAGEAKLWDAANCLLLLTFSGHTAGVTSVAFSPDGTKVLTGSWDKTAKLWDASNGSLLLTFSGHTDYVWSVAFSPDGTKVLMGAWTEPPYFHAGASLWDAATGSLLATFDGHRGTVLSVAFSADGTKVLTGSGDNTAKLWDATNGSVLRTFSGHTGPVYSVAFSRDGTKVLTGGDNTAKLWDATNGSEIRTFSGHTGHVYSVAFSPDGTKVLTGSQDGTARLWEIWRAKAVIVAGGGMIIAGKDNVIAEQTKQLAAYCYKICRRRGYAPNEIQYLSAFGPQDADGDGNDDVDAYATPAALQQTLDTFASDTARLFIYMVDHGYSVGDGMYFQMNPSQTLAASELDAWLDDLQTSPTTRPTGPNCHVTLIVDTCYSGNFLSACRPPAGARRLTIASTTDDAVAVFLPPPSLTSFSYQFLGALYMGYKVQEAFESARQFFVTLAAANQTPWIDSDGDGVYVRGVDDSTTGPAAQEFFGTSWAYAAGGGWEPPAFEAVTENLTPELGSTVTIWVRMLPFQNPQRVWATILPPAAEPLAGQALTDLPRVELAHTTGTRWEAPFGGLDTVGPYVVAHVAAFENERITQPVYSHINVGAPANPPPIKAIIVSGDDGSGAISSQTIALANLAYRVSRHRGYQRDDIRYLSGFGRQDADGDLMRDDYASATLANVTDALSTWATSDCARLLVYVVGPGEKVGGQAVFRLSASEVLTSSTLDSYLDALQSTSGVEDVVVVADFPYAAEFLRGCQPPTGARRVLIAGTDSPNAVFLNPPQCTSFSFSFLSAAHMGHNLKASFDAARDFFRALSQLNQRPWLDDDGDGDSDKWDGTHAQTLHWGYPWAFAGPEGSELPFILEVGPTSGTTVTFDAMLWADLIEGPLPRRVFATIIPPSAAYSPGQPITGFPTIDLLREGSSWRWSAVALAFGDPGLYTVLYQALYECDRLSAPVVTHLLSGATGSRHWRWY